MCLILVLSKLWFSFLFPAFYASVFPFMLRMLFPSLLASKRFSIKISLSCNLQIRNSVQFLRYQYIPPLHPKIQTFSPLQGRPFFSLITMVLCLKMRSPKRKLRQTGVETKVKGSCPYFRTLCASADGSWQWGGGERIGWSWCFLHISLALDQRWKAQISKIHRLQRFPKDFQS